MSVFPALSTINCTYLTIRPHKPLADNIVSHEITATEFLNILNFYKIENTGKVATYYYLYDQVMEYDQDRKVNCYVSYLVDTKLNQAGDTEISSFLKFSLSPSCFPIKQHYHHERQAIIFSKLIRPGVEIRLDMLVVGILDPADRYRQISFLLENIKDKLDSDILSLSYALIIDPKSYLDGIQVYNTLFREVFLTK